MVEGKCGLGALFRLALIFEIRMGAYFHGVLINACNFLIACSCVGM